MALALALVLATAPRPGSAQQRVEEAKAAYLAGKAAYEQKHYDEALEQFKRSYTLSGQTALLYNISSALQGLNRPGEAATALREFLKLRPTEPERAEIEQRIASLDRAQAVMDRDAEHKRRLEEEELARQKRSLELQHAREPQAGWLTEAEAERRLELVRERDRKQRRRTLGLALGISAGTLVVAGVVVGVVCGLGKCGSGDGPKDYDFAKATVTP